MTPAWLQLVIVSVTSVIASSGFWAWLQSRKKEKTSTDQLLMVLARDRLISQGMRYIQRKWISNDELDDYETNLYEPYKALGGNGVAERIAEEVKRLELRSYTRYSEVAEGEPR